MWWTVVNAVMKFQVPQNAENVDCLLPGRAKDLSAPLCIINPENRIQNLTL